MRDDIEKDKVKAIGRLQRHRQECNVTLTLRSEQSHVKLMCVSGEQRALLRTMCQRFPIVIFPNVGRDASHQSLHRHVGSLRLFVNP